jgi:DNA mismatch repair protein MutL
MIKKLDPLVIAQIAAGEVIEDPAGALKELLENSIDANATVIDVFLEDWGLSNLQVRDNGIGIDVDQLKVAVDNFSTSKLEIASDLNSISTLGFRGEALASIRSVSKLKIQSKPEDQDSGYELLATDKNISEPIPCAMNSGTRLEAKDFFYNLPVRKKFLPDDQSLRKKILRLSRNFLLSNIQINFRLFNNNIEILNMVEQALLIDRISQVQPGIIDSLLPVYFKKENIEIRGFISNFQTNRSGPTEIHFFVNGRAVQFSKLPGILRNVYGELLTAGKYPVCYLFLTCSSSELDVNIHPQKKEVQFYNESLVITLIESATKEQMGATRPISYRNTLGKIKKEEGQNFSESSQSFLNFKPSNYSTELEDKSSAFSVSKIHSKLFNTFLLASSEDGIYLVDQHTAHERINYEKFLQSLKKDQGNFSQRLLIPLSLTLANEEKDIIERYRESLLAIGFDFSDLGPAGIVVKSIPWYISEGQEKESVEILLKILERSKGPDSIEVTDLFDQLAKDLSCKASITKGDDSSIENLEMLLEKLQQCEEPGRCPHGRPTMIEFKRDEIFSMFKRKAD